MPDSLLHRTYSRTASQFFALFRALNRAPCLFFAAGLCLFTATAQAATCSSPHYDESAYVKRVFDGDTLQLSDGRKLRLIGVNTPERGKKERPAEPQSEKAWRMLQMLAAPGSRLRLRWGKEKKDRYGRLLAHAFSADGRNLSASLLAAGMGAAIQIPPNLWAWDCYVKAEKTARKQQRGIWGQAYFAPLDAHRLAADVQGFHFIRGRLSRVGNSKTSVWLNLGEHFALRIRKKDLAYFRQIDFNQLVGRELTARGWIYAYKGQQRMNLHHPASLEISPAR